MSDAIVERRLGAWPLGGERCRFRVWAPGAGDVELEIVAPGRRRHELAAEDGRYFVREVEDGPAGTLYRFRLDGREGLPDPASRSQPQGVHGPSAVVPAASDWDGTVLYVEERG